MKKILSYILVVLTVCGFLGCSNNTTKEDNKVNINDGNIVDAPIYENYHFNTYNELREWFKTAKEDTVNDEKTIEFEEFIDNINSGIYSLQIPFVDGIEMALRNEEGFSNITLMVKELYSRPRIYYHNVFDGYQITIGQTHYLESDVVNVDSCSETIKSIAPNAPNIDNYQNFESYKNIYERQYETASGNISAIVCELKNSNTVIVFLVYGDVLIDIEGDSDVLTEDFFKKLEFRPIA